MALRLIVGKANTGKTGAAMDAVRSARAAGQRPVLVLPSEPDVLSAATELARSGALGFRVRTFEGFLMEAWNERGDGRAIVTAAQRRLLASAAARSVGATRGLGELATTCVQTLSEQVGESWRAPSPRVRGNGAPLANAIEHYRDSLERLSLLEQGEAAHQLSADSSLGRDLLVVHRFTDLAPWQERLIAGASRNGDVILTLTWEAGFAPTIALDALVARLGVEPELAGQARFHMSPELAFVTDRLFSDPEPPPSHGAITFSLAEGHEAEAHRIAEEVMRALEESGNPQEAPVAVVFRRPEIHYRYLRQAFGEAGIDAEYDVRVPLPDTALGAAVLNALDFALEGDRDRLLAVLKSPFAAASREDALDLERRWRARGVREPDELVGALRSASEDLRDVFRVLRKTAAAPADATAARVLSQLATRLLVLGHGRAGALGAAMSEDAAAHATIQRVFSDLAAVDDDRLVLRDVRDALKTAIVTTPVEEKPGAVHVTAVDRIRGRRFGTLVLGGLTASEFPAPPSESMLPGSAVENVMRAFGGTGQRLRGTDYEQLLFYSAITRPRERLVLSARTSDSDGEPEQVSPLFQAVADFYRAAENDDDLPQAVTRQISQLPLDDEAATPRERARAFSLFGSGDARSLAAVHRAAPRQSQLSDENLLSWLNGREVFSASDIEAYLQCPYGWFFDRVLRPAPLESEFDARQQGSFAHAVLHKTYLSLQAAGQQRVTPANLPMALALVEDSWRAVDAESPPPASPCELSQRRVTLDWARRIIEDDATMFSGFAPAHHEWRFGLGDVDAIDMGGFGLRGAVDRIDVDSEGRAIVMDYKRSNAVSADRMLQDGKLQLPLYIEAVRRGLGVSPVAALYRALNRRSDRGLIVSDADVEGSFTRTDLKTGDEFDRIVGAAMERAREAVTGMRAGRIPREPADAKRCASCPASVSCGAAT